MKLGEQIKKLRIAKNLTQSELSRRVNVTKATISAYENDTRQPSYRVLIKIAQLFNVSIDNLLGYSSKYVIDVTDLNQHQRNTIGEIVKMYKMQNYICEKHNYLYDIAEEMVRDNNHEKDDE